MLRKILIAGAILIGFIGGLILWNIIEYRIPDVKTSKNSNGYSVYSDKKFGYSFSYPSNWSLNKGGPLDHGFVAITPPDEKNQIQFWYKDSERAATIDDLKRFVEDDARYAEEHQQTKTISITKEELNGNEVIVLKSTTQQGLNTYRSTQYYFADFSPTPDQLIFIWTINISSLDKKEPSHNEEITRILKSYKLN